MKKILLPTDFSENAWNAIAYAMQLFHDDRCEFILLHTYVPAFYRVDYALGGPAYSGIDDAMIQATISGLERTVSRIEEEFPNLRHTFHQRYAFNLLTDEISEITAEEDIDLVLMGTKGATGAEKVLFGSNAVFTLRKSKAPVLLIPAGYKYSKPKHIVFPTDYLRVYEAAELKPMTSILNKFKATLTVLRVEEDEEELTEKQQSNRDRLAECLGDIRYIFEKVEDGVMPTAVEKYVEDHPCDMLVMLNRKHSFIERLLLRQNVDTLGFELDIPFLVIQSNAKLNV
ncbi:universal stress protein [Robertkochia aurantiaca]|uniref:universal stress protein n=1 Tax=Robertkochia aurantiaca TaxID=2873700 RepID=UPI001CCB359C|nr:universal stress protein [Robertkochia sp. 3YJGBD-33]